MVFGAEDVHQSLQILLATARNERVLAEPFGCDLHGYLFEEVSQRLINDLTRIITDSILYHEARIDLNEVNVSESADTPGLLLISIGYTLRTTNSRYNMVYPFYLNEAVAAGN
ncbi:MAG: GPW/gp25 family protein [Methylococcaceae bacterium]|nr:GPW/gp25 family protein [Methylococcaceae bacterium]